MGSDELQLLAGPAQHAEDPDVHGVAQILLAQVLWDRAFLAHGADVELLA